MNDFQDILKVFMESEEDKFTRPNLRNVGSGVGNEGDAKAALMKWLQAHTQEYNVLKQQVYGAIQLLKEVYDKLPDYDQTTASAAAGVSDRPDIAATQTADKKAKLAAAMQQFQSKLRGPQQAQPEQPPTAGGTV